MKTLVVAATLAAAALGAGAAPTVASAQPFGREWRDVDHGPRWDAYRRGYFGRYHRYPARVCERTGRGPVCFYR